MKNKNNKSETITFRLEQDKTENLRKLSHKLSIERNEHLLISDLIREAIDNTFPLKETKSK